jgi:hypothetical protein
LIGTVLPRDAGAGAWAAIRMIAGTSKAKGGRMIGIGSNLGGGQFAQRFQPLDVLVVGGGGGGTGAGAVGLTMAGFSPVPSGCGVGLIGTVLPRNAGRWDEAGLADAWAATRIIAGTSKT